MGVYFTKGLSNFKNIHATNLVAQLARADHQVDANCQQHQDQAGPARSYPGAESDRKS